MAGFMHLAVKHNCVGGGSLSSKWCNSKPSEVAVNLFSLHFHQIFSLLSNLGIIQTEDYFNSELNSMGCGSRSSHLTEVCMDGRHLRGVQLHLLHCLQHHLDAPDSLQ